MHAWSTLSLCCVLALSASPAEAAFKCWKNKDGVKECGPTVPPEYVGQGHEDVSGTGVVVGKTGKAKAPEEYAREEAEARAKKKAAEEQARSEALQAEEDRVLLDSFASEDDIIMARDGKLTSIDVQLAFSKSTIEKLEADLGQRIAEAAEQERLGQAVPEKLQNDIVTVRQQIESQKRFMQEREQEKLKIAEENAALLERYQALRQKRAEQEQAAKSGDAGPPP